MVDLVSNDEMLRYAIPCLQRSMVALCCPVSGGPIPMASYDGAAYPPIGIGTPAMPIAFICTGLYIMLFMPRLMWLMLLCVYGFCCGAILL